MKAGVRANRDEGEAGRVAKGKLRMANECGSELSQWLDGKGQMESGDSKVAESGNRSTEMPSTKGDLRMLLEEDLSVCTLKRRKDRCEAEAARMSWAAW